MMNFSYPAKVAFIRVLFIVVIATCYLLYRQHLTDYVILIFIITMFLGIFPLSMISISNREVVIKKNYFWGIIGCQWILSYDQITSISSKEYEIESETQELFLSFIPNLRWETSKIYFRQNGNEDDIELKLTKDEFRTIDLRIKPHL